MLYEQCVMLSPLQVGKTLGLGRNKTYRLIRDGVIPSILLGKRRFVPRAAIDKLLDVTSAEDRGDNINDN